MRKLHRKIKTTQRENKRSRVVLRNVFFSLLFAMLCYVFVQLPPPPPLKKKCGCFWQVFQKCFGRFGEGFCRLLGKLWGGFWKEKIANKNKLKLKMNTRKACKKRNVVLGGLYVFTFSTIHDQSWDQHHWAQKASQASAGWFALRRYRRSAPWITPTPMSFDNNNEISEGKLNVLR